MIHEKFWEPLIEWVLLYYKIAALDTFSSLCLTVMRCTLHYVTLCDPLMCVTKSVSRVHYDFGSISLICTNPTFAALQVRIHLRQHTGWRDSIIQAEN